jgi:nucleotide-binding universal stress UspA family protein
MKPVLLATDGSPTAEQALESAIDLARLLDTDLTVVTVWNIPYGVGGFGAPVVVDGELAKLSEEQARRVNAEAASRAEEAGVETRSLVLRGFPVEEICLAAKSVEPQLLVVGSHDWGVVRRAVFGSVSTGVLHHAPCPVLVVRGDQPAVESTRRRDLELVEA